jgi:BolA protein
MSDRISMIRERLTRTLEPTRLDIIDQSAAHAGHEGAKSGGGHYVITIVAAAFAGLPLLKRHRLIYAAMGEAMKDEIHALSIRAYAPDESTTD